MCSSVLHGEVAWRRAGPPARASPADAGAGGRADLQRARERRAPAPGGARRRFPMPTSSSSTTTAPTARATSSPRWPPSSGRSRCCAGRASRVSAAPTAHGFDYALDHGYDVVVSMDVDLSHDPEVLPELLRLIEAGADAVIGSRYVPGGATVDWPLHRRVLSRWGNRYTSFVLRLQVRDCTSGYRAYPCRGAQGDRPGIDDGRGLRLPHRARAPPRARRPARDRDADRVPRSPLRHVEDVRPHRRRVDVARDDVGAPRRLRRVTRPARRGEPQAAHGGVADDADRGPHAVAPADLLALGVGAPAVGDADLVDPPPAAGDLGRQLRLDPEAVLAQRDAVAAPRAGSTCSTTPCR